MEEEPTAKSTFLKSFKKCSVIMPSRPPRSFWLQSIGNSHPTEVADLQGSRFVVAVDMEDGKRMAEALVKQMTGGDRIKARFMHQDFFEFQPTHKLFLAANHMPIIRGTDHGIWRRIRLVPFTVTIQDEKQDKGLLAKLRTELSGILDVGCEWLFSMATKWTANSG